ncbi:Predicted branched-chain amino acid permease (azaleucine resistance) [Tessaracoccus bendigoensis DSM 12906]|uniref:Predicted branched-chain amino acid permease (Azaleucine resistance) n=1 Tax=Tessaracoccus bendigoensis DSM 12906 TaxID=1123357 RepID=A0A1M6P472_9ACTN|nr:AzlC family ABC transporter permease [Tessaracoccus bendigoensis]SHK02718.1 Predicted branched-chain amino acid permease (azaleucine resistance) [Tessaracoccus bendigoensis DSM 12906]
MPNVSRPEPSVARGFGTTTSGPHTVALATRQGIWVGLATGAYGISFGALSVASGLNVWQTCLLSLLMFTGGSQFAFIGVIAGGGAGPAAATTAFLLGVRNSLYSLQMAPLLRLRGPKRLAAAHVTIDESAAVSLAQPDERARRAGFWAAGLGVFLFWNLATLGGALLGNVLGDPAVWGLDGAAAAAFVALLRPRLKERQAQAVGAVAAVVAVLLVPFSPAGIPILAAGGTAAAVGAWQFARVKGREES